jgi:hypothetical protein
LFVCPRTSGGAPWARMGMGIAPVGIKKASWEKRPREGFMILLVPGTGIEPVRY